ncbi:hypothetical protein JCM10908_000198 [Rhodotorula pacifica]|uniref:Stu1p n=1 Tax=Rhodotorula pacifica TaxID=1495444 RepID=UPI00317AFE9F
MDWRALEPGLAHPDTDKRILALQQLKLLLTQHRGPISDPDHLVAALKPSLKSSNSLISSNALAALEPFFFSIGSSSSPYSLKYALSQLLPWDKLADAKPATRQLATRAIIAAGRASLAHSNSHAAPDSTGSPWSIVEVGLREHGFASKNARAREQALHILVALRCPSPSPDDPAHDPVAHPLPPLRPFTPLLLPLLGDADPSVRSVALESTIRIFADSTRVSDAARADLKKEMQRLEVSHKVQEQVLGQVFGREAQTLEQERSASPTASGSSAGSRTRSVNGLGGSSSLLATTSASGASKVGRSPPVSTTSRLSASDSAPVPAPVASTSSSALAPTPPPSSSSSTDIPPVYIASPSDLEAEFSAMQAGFEGRETEHNWTARDRSIARMRGMLVAGITRDEHHERKGLREAFVRCVKEVQEGIIKTASSLRTTVALSALSLISELASALPPSPAVEHLLDSFLCHCLSVAGQTKKIVAAGSQATVTTLLQAQSTINSFHHLRTVQLVVALLGEKTASARQFGAQHVLTLLQRVHTTRTSKQALDSNGGAEVLAQAVRKGLGDANPQVRETTRVAYWVFERIWPERAAGILAGLDASGRKLLEKARPAAEEAAAAPPFAAVLEHAEGPEAISASPVRNGASPARTSPVQTRGPITTAATAAAKKPSVREAMMAARKKMLAEKEKENGDHHQRQQDGFLSLGEAQEGEDSSLPPPVPLVPASPLPPLGQQPASSNFETPTRARARAAAAHSPASYASENSSPSTPRQGDDRDHIPEPIVDAALRDQARQAELAAERLLELSLDDEADADGPPSTAAAGEGHATPTSVATPQSERRTAAARTPRSAATFATPLPNPALRKFARPGAATAVFEDSPDPRDATGAAAGRGGWWVRQRQTEPAAPTVGEDDPLGSRSEPTVTDEQRTELSKLVAELCRADNATIEVPALRKLSELSRQVPIREFDTDGGFLESSSNPFAAFADAAAGDEGSTESSRTSGSFWREDRRFDKLYEGLKALLLRPEAEVSEPARDAALRLLRDFVENQSACFIGGEASLFELVFKLRENPSRTSIAATEVISTSLAAGLEPVYGLGALKPALSSYLSSSAAPSPGSSALGLRILGSFYERLPGEVVEDVLPQWADLLRRALENADSGDLRRAAIMALVSAQSALASSAIAADDDADGVSAQRLDELVGGLRPDQRNLVAYYRARRR